MFSGSAVRAPNRGRAHGRSLMNASLMSASSMDSRASTAVARTQQRTARHVLDTVPGVAAELVDVLLQPDVTGSISNDGVTLVRGNSLYIGTFAGACHKLKLSGGSTTGALVARASSGPRAGNICSVFAATPTGAVRVWEDVTRPAAYHDDVIAVADDAPLTHVVACNRATAIAVAADGTLWRVSLAAGGIARRRVERQASMLASIGKRIGLGRMLGLDEAPHVGPVRSARVGRAIDDGCELLVLTDRLLQVWHITSTGETLAAEANVLDILSRRVAAEDPAGNHREFVLIDVADASNLTGPVVLAASVLAIDAPRDITFHLLTVRAEAGTLRTSQHGLLPYSPREIEADTSQLAARLVIPPGGNAAFVQFGTFVVPTSVPSDDRQLDLVNFDGDFIIASGEGRGGALMMLTGHRGAITLKQTEPPPVAAPLVARSDPTANAPRELSGVIADAYVLWARGDAFAADADLTRQLDAIGVEAFGAQLVASSRALLDVRPVFDPTWAEERGREDAVPTTILRHQLNEKQRKHEQFMRFLTALEPPFVDKLSPDTREELLGHGSKLAAARALRTLQNEAASKDNAPGLSFENVLLRAMHRTLDMRGRGGEATGVQDTFFVEVTSIDDILGALLDVEAAVLREAATAQKADGPQQRIDVVVAANRIFEALFRAAMRYRHEQASAYRVDAATCLPWTASERSRAQLDAQVTTTLRMMEELKGVVAVADPDIFASQLSVVGDILLSSAEMALSHSSGEAGRKLDAWYAQRRREIIAPFMQAGHFERAQQLAERHDDFGVLVELCETQDMPQQLEKYTVEYRGLDFASFLFQWYLERGLLEKLLVLGENPVYREALTAFLQAHPNLLWMHSLFTGDSATAAAALLEVGRAETESIARRRTLMSLQRLAVYAENGVHDELLADSTVELNFLDAHTRLPGNTKVLSAAGLIRALTGDVQKKPEADDFVHALEILDEPAIAPAPDATEYVELLDTVWQRIMGASRWDELVKEMDRRALSETEVAERLRDTVFFQVAAHVGDQSGVRPTREVLDRVFARDQRLNAPVQRLVLAAFHELSAGEQSAMDVETAQ